MKATLQVTYYLEVISSWCHWAEPTWAALKAQYVGKVDFEWQIALMEPSAFPQSQAQCDWFYRRSGLAQRSPYCLHSGWFEPGLAPFLAPNLMALAARELGVVDDTVRLALSNAAVREGKKVGQWQVAADVASVAAPGLDRAKLLEKARSPEVLRLVEDSTEEFRLLQVTQRPTFVLESSIGDRAVFSGLVHFEPIAATLDAMLTDERAYRSFEAHFGQPPA